MLFFLLLKRDIGQIFTNPRLVILPFAFFLISLFLISFTGGHGEGSGNMNALYWVIFILSTTGVLGQNIAQDHGNSFLQALQSDCLDLTPYIIAKAMSLLIAWSIPIWIFRIGGAFFEGGLTIDFCLQQLLITVTISGALAFLYCLFDVLFLEGKQSPFLGLVLLTPFILPLLILALMGLEQGAFEALLPAISYGSFLMIGSFFLTKQAICR